MAHREKLSTGLVGVSGEYFVAAELSGRGYVASVDLKLLGRLEFSPGAVAMRFEPRK